MRIALLTSFLSLLAVTPAAADTTLGQLAPSAHTTCLPGQVYLQTESAPGPISYTVPAPGGVITSWSETPLAGEGRERLVVARPTSPGRFTVIGLSPEETVSGTSTQTFLVRIPVAAGDVLGLDSTSGSFACEFPGETGDLVDVIPGQPAVGVTLPEPKKTEPRERLNLTAVVEPDVDHDGYGDTTQDACPTDPSTHEACPAPKVSGTARVGQTLSATPGGEPENPAFAWLRCAAGGESCYPIPGATGLTYLVSPIDVGHVLRFRKTAHNSAYTAVSESEATAVVPFQTIAVVTPRLSHLTQSTRRWREGNSLPRLTNNSSVSLGTVFGFNMNLPTTVWFAFTQRSSGRLSAHRCVAPSRLNKHAHRCTRTITVALLSFAARVGTNRVLFEGRVSPTQRLKPGTYTVTVTAGPSALKSASRTLAFTITR